MADSRTRQDSLHQQASALYLQGDFVRALAVWREVLGLDPNDERALEGARLCELLVEDAGIALPPPPPRPNATPPPAPPAPSAFAEGPLADDSLDEIDAILGGAGLKPEPRPPSPSPAPDADDSSFDLSDPGEPDAAAPADSDFSFSFGDDIDRPPQAPDRAASERAAAIAADELKRRTGELMAEAADLYSQGRREEALGVVERLLILDDENRSAQAFADQIRAELDGPPPGMEDGAIAFEPPDPDPAEAARAAEAAALNHEPFEFDEEEALDLGTAAAAPAPPAARASAAAPPAAAARPEPETARPRAGAPPVLEAPALARSAGRNARGLGIAAGAVLLAGLAFVAISMFGGDDAPASDPAPESAAVPAPRPAAKGKGQGEPPAVEVPAPSAAAAAPAAAAAVPALPPADLGSALARARAAFDARDYGAAILAYDQVLAADPDHAEARDRLQEAGELYREQKLALEQRAAAIRSFQQGDYREALRLLYRLPADESDTKAELDRFKSNGWYNLGLQALSGGDCRAASEHLGEARTLDGTDPDVARALALVQACRSGSRPQSYYDAVRQLPWHGLAD